MDCAGYRYWWVTKQLRREGWRVNRKRVARVMRQESLQCQVKRRWVGTTDSDHGYAGIRICLRSVGLRGRISFGWAISEHIDTELTLAALKDGFTGQEASLGLYPSFGLCGIEASHAYVEELRAAGMKISMARWGNPYDNAVAESFMKTLKYEEVHLWDYQTAQDVTDRVPYFLEEVYNQNRLYSALGYLTPTEFEEQWRRRNRLTRPYTWHSNLS